MFSLLGENVSKNLIVREIFIRLTIEEAFEKLDLNKASFQEKLFQEKEQLFSRFFARVSVDPDNQEEVAKFLKETNQTLEEVFDKIVYEEKLKLFKRSLISQAKVKDFFIDNQSSYRKVNVFILLFDEEAFGEELRRIVLEDNLDFENFVQEVVKSGEAQVSFKFTGLVNVNSLNPEIVEQVNQIKPQELSKVFKLKNKYSIIKLVDLQIPEITKKIREEIEEKFFKDWLSKQIKLGNPKLVKNKLDKNE